MKIALGADHHGVALKAEVAAFLEGSGHEVLDLGAHEVIPDDDYPDRSAPVARAVVAGEAERGVIICGSGVGAAIAANKIPGARASVCHDTYSARQGVEHDDMNVLCLGALIIGSNLAGDLVAGFVGATLDPHPRFRRRIEKVSALETEARKAAG